MTDDNTSSYFKKFTRTSTRFLRKIWRYDKKYTETIPIYREYSRRHTQSYINDFVNHCSSVSTNLSTEEILSIHETNADLSHCCSNNSKDSNLKHKHAVASDLQEPQLSSSRENISSNSDEDYQWTPYLTDALLDKFHIPPGQRETRREAYEMKSKLFFHCLSYKIGTFHLIKCRQKLFTKNLENILPIINPYFNINVIGSKSEGLDIDGSDTDVLFVKEFAHETKFNIYNRMASYYTYCSLEQGVYPGYVLLRKMGYVILKSCDFRNSVQQQIKEQKLISRMANHGPAMMQSIYHNDCDIVFSVRSPDWPERADGWKTRKRYFGWPSEEMITNITKKGCHVVPVGTKRNHDLDTEWRLSFCVAERELVWTFNQPQILIYGLLKVVLKEIINPNCIEKDLLCSYFMKTVMFWVIEETNPSIWSPNNMMFLFHLTFDRLVQCVAENYCPNYFIPSNNMLKDRINDANRVHLLRLLLAIKDSGMAWMYQCKSLRSFANFFGINVKCSSRDLYSIRLKSIKKGIICSYILIQDLVFHYRIRICLMHHTKKKMIKDVFKSIKSRTIKRNVLPFLVHFIKTNAHSTDNKTLASLHKFCMDLHLQDAFGSIPSGKSSLVSYLYCEGKFIDCLDILNSMVEICDMDLSAIHDRKKTPKYKYFLRMCIKCATWTHLKYFFTRDILIPFTSHLLSNELKALLPNAAFRNFVLQRMNWSHTSVYPLTFIHYIRFLCLMKLGLYDELDQVCELLNNIVTQSTTNPVFEILLLCCCYALKRGRKLDFTNDKNFMHSLYSNPFELGLPLHLLERLRKEFYCRSQDISSGSDVAGMNSNWFEQTPELPSSVAQCMRDYLSELPPLFREACMQGLREEISNWPPVFQQKSKNVFSKYGVI